MKIADKNFSGESKIINGKEFAGEICNIVKKQVSLLQQNENITPGLAVVLVGSDPASKVYVSNKNKKAKELGINSYEIILDKGISEEELLNKIEELNNDNKVNGILVQLPLPNHIDKLKIINAIDPNKDVDGFHKSNVGKLFTQQNGLVPCTPLGCILLLKKYLGMDLVGKKAVIFGRSNIVGRPMSELLQQEHCTTVLLHARSKNVIEEAQTADIIVSAIGKPNIINSGYIKPGAVVIDVGINRVTIDGKGKLVGDVDFDDVSSRASKITPVPGGVGPMTIACLMINALKATCWQNNLDEKLYLEDLI